MTQADLAPAIHRLFPGADYFVGGEILHKRGLDRFEFEVYVWTGQRRVHLKGPTPAALLERLQEAAGLAPRLPVSAFDLVGVQV